MGPFVRRHIIMTKDRCSKNLKCWDSARLARWSMVLEVFVLFLCTGASPIEGETVLHQRGDFTSTAGRQGDLCVTPECLDIAYALLKNMDVTVDPCDNFYRYACGGFINETILPENEGKVNILITGEKKVREQLKILIEADIESNEPRPTKLVKKFYRTCMNAETSPGLNLLHARLKDFGGWPVLLGDGWDDTEFVWIDLIYKFRDAGFGYNSLINSAVDFDIYNNTRRAITINPAVFGIDRSYLLEGFDNRHVQAYYKLMVDTAVMLGGDKKRALKELKEALTFEMQLAQITLQDWKRRRIDKFYISMTLTALSRTSPSIPWKEYFNRLLPSPITVENDEVVLVSDPHYLTRLERLLAKTPKRVQANYLIWGPIKFSEPYLNHRWTSDRCCTTAFTYFPSVIGAMYVKRHFSEKAREKATEMVTDIRRQFNVILEKIEWMDDQTRMSALEKAAAMANHIGYPDELLDDDKLEKIYEKLDISEGNHLESTLNVNHLNEDLSMGKLHTPRKETDWNAPGNAATVEAFHSWYTNSLQLPAGILQNIFLDKDRPNFMKYADFGYAIGHEITHGFDDTGKQFDKNGNLFDWWAPSTEEQFRRRKQCIIEQYRNYIVPEVGLHLDSVGTLNENIADNGGIKIAYLAFKSWLARKKAEKMLVGFGRTPEQMFWLSAANFWCAKYTDEGLRSEIILEPHSPEEFRIIGSFSNMPEFANDYNCPEGSKMNPKKKCSIW